MPTTRGASDNSRVLRSKFDDYLGIYGSNPTTNITRNRITVTRNSEGRVSGNSTVAVSIKGDMQFGAKVLKEYIDLGIASMGDGVFFTTYDADIEANDEIVVNSITWKLTKQVEGETINSVSTYQAWIAVRKPEA